jgi:transaldolase
MLCFPPLISGAVAPLPADAVVKKVHHLCEMYSEMGVAPTKLIFRVPGTWEAIQAAGMLEREGIATQVFHVYR